MSKKKAKLKFPHSVWVSSIERLFIQTKRFLVSYVGPVSQVIGTILTGFSIRIFSDWSSEGKDGSRELFEFLYDTPSSWPMSLGVGLIIFGIIVNACRTKDNDTLRAQIEESKRDLVDCQESFEDLRGEHLAALQRLVEDALWSLYGRAFDNSDTCRLSVYEHRGSAFALIARVSKSPTFKQKGRTAYADTDGVIGQAFQYGQFECNNLPDPTTEYDGYCERMAQQNLVRETIDDISMKSRHLIGIALDDSERRTRIGVLIAESIELGKVSLESVMHETRHLENVLNNYLHEREKVGINLSLAEDQGF